MEELYLFTQLQIFNDDTTSQAVFKYTDYNDALIAYHSFMFSSMSNDNIKSTIALVTDIDGIPRIRDKWNREPVGDIYA